MFLGGPLFNDQTGPPLHAHYQPMRNSTSPWAQKSAGSSAASLIQRRFKGRRTTILWCLKGLTTQLSSLGRCNGLHVARNKNAAPVKFSVWFGPAPPLAVHERLWPTFLTAAAEISRTTLLIVSQLALWYCSGISSFSPSLYLARVPALET